MTLVETTASIPITPLITNSVVSFWQVGNKTGVMQIPAFGDVDSFAPLMNQGFALFQQRGVTQLIIDLSNNGGGELDAGYAILNYLFDNFTYGLNDMIESTLADALVLAADQQPEAGTYWNYNAWIDPSTLQPFTSSSPWWFPGIVYDRGNIKGSYSLKFQDNFTQSLDELPPPPLNERFSPQHIRVLSNVWCGSTCAVTSRQLQEYDNVKTVAVGGLPTVPIGISTTPGGEVTDLDSVLQMIQQLGQASNPLAPAAFPTSASMRFTIREIYPFNAGAPNLPLEFYFQASTLRIPYSLQTAMNPTLVWLDILNTF